jgi:hypothetical protein
MKFLTLVVLLASLVSCGGSDGGGNSAGPVKERYQNAFSTLVRGQSANSKALGQIRSYDFNTETVTSAPVDTEEFSVVIKITDTNVYTYKVTTDKTDGSVEKEVSLESHDASQMDEILKLPGTYMLGDMLKFSMSFENDWEIGAANVNETYVLNASLNLGMPLCEMNMTVTSTGSIIRTSGTTPLPAISNNTNQTCGRILSSSELRAIDLSSIEFCDETTVDDEYSCESNRDMSFLTADL